MRVDLGGRRAVVTGGGRGIGRALSLGLARSGADLAIVYRTDAGAAEAGAEEARREPAARRFRPPVAEMALGGNMVAAAGAFGYSLGSDAKQVEDGAGAEQPEGVQARAPDDSILAC